MVFLLLDCVLRELLIILEVIDSSNPVFSVSVRGRPFCLHLIHGLGLLRCGSVGTSCSRVSEKFLAMLAEWIFQA